MSMFTLGEKRVEAMQELLRTLPKATFTCTRLRYQNFAEVDPAFHNEHIGELKDDWYVMNNTGTFHKLKYNMNNYFPQITEGWEELKKFEDFPNNAEVIFGYYGGRLFGVISSIEIHNWDEIEAYHSRSIKPKETVWFDVCLSEQATKMRKLKVKNGLAVLLREKRIEAFSVCTDDGESYGLRVRVKEDTDHTELGNNWFLICQCNNFRGGDVVRFKFGQDNRCHLFKL